MTLQIGLAAGALAAAVLLLLSSPSRVVPGVAVLAAGAEVAMALGLVRVHILDVPLGLALPLALAIPGVLAWLRATTKPTISAAAIVAFVGVLQTAMYLSARAG